jgi:hypothetical protein
MNVARRDSNDNVLVPGVKDFVIDHDIDFDSDDDSDDEDAEIIVEDESTNQKKKTGKLFSKQDCFRIVQCLRLENDVATSDEVRDLKVQLVDGLQ